VADDTEDKLLKAKLRGFKALNISFIWVSTPISAVAAVRSGDPFDLVFLDQNFGAGQPKGHTICNTLKTLNEKYPVIVCGWSSDFKNSDLPGGMDLSLEKSLDSLSKFLHLIAQHDKATAVQLFRERTAAAKG
jgi:CheY-like chemotaxis protein